MVCGLPQPQRVCLLTMRVSRPTARSRRLCPAHRSEALWRSRARRSRAWSTILKRLSINSDLYETILSAPSTFCDAEMASTQRSTSACSRASKATCKRPRLALALGCSLATTSESDGANPMRSAHSSAKPTSNGTAAASADCGLGRAVGGSTRVDLNRNVSRSASRAAVPRARARRYGGFAMPDRQLADANGPTRTNVKSTGRRRPR